MKCLHYLHLHTSTRLNYSVPRSALVMSMKKAMGLGNEKALSASPTHTVPGFGGMEEQMLNRLLIPSRVKVIPPPILDCRLGENRHCPINGMEVTIYQGHFLSKVYQEISPGG